MSQVRPLIDGWIGYGDGSSMLVETGNLLDADHPLVLERPELFEAVGEPTPAPAAPAAPAKRATKKAAPGGTDG